MPSNIGNSIIRTTYIPGGAGGRGAQGPTGPMGSTGNTGPIGNTGSAGYNIQTLTQNGNTVVITLNDPNNTSITINGLTGNIGSAPAIYGSDPDQYYEFRGTVPSADDTQNFLLIESVNGVTTTFKVIEGIGITFSNNGNDFVIEGPATASTRNLQNKRLVGASGSTAISLIDTEYFSGITYDILNIVGITGFLHSLTDNINTSNQTVNIQNTNISINQFYYNSTDKKWYNKNIFKFNDGLNTVSINDENALFDATNYSNYPYIPDIGSCCFCNTDDEGLNSSVCYDYFTQEQCLGLSGSYSVNQCSSRTSDSACRNSVPENGVCCTCGSNHDDGTTNISSCTQSLPKEQCLSLGFVYIPLPGGADCNSHLATCSALDCDQTFTKKKIIKLASKTYPSDYSCGITEDGNVLCWGELLGSRLIEIRISKKECTNINDIEDWFADDIAIGENHILILAKPIAYETCDQFVNNTPPLDPVTKLPVLKNNKTKLYSKSFAKSIFENLIDKRSNIVFGTMGIASPYERIIGGLYGKHITISPPSSTYDYFIGINRADRSLFGKGYAASQYRQYDYPLFPLPEGQFLDVSATGLHAAGLRTDGTIVTWGSNTFYQLRTPKINKKFVRVVTGRYHTCALTDDGKVMCWGAGTTADAFGVWPHYGQSTIPSVLNDKTVIQIECGYYFSAALTDTGDVYTWGSFRGLTQASEVVGANISDFSGTIFSQIRKDINRELVPKPTELNSVKIKRIACSPYSIAVLGRNNKLYAWGHDGEIGTTLDTGSNLPKKGIPSAIQRFNKQLELQGINLDTIKISEFAVDRDENVYLLFNSYGCAGNTYLNNIFNENKTPASGGSNGMERPSSEGLTGIALFHYSTNIDLSNYKQYSDYQENTAIWKDGINNGCFNCRVMNETEFERLKNTQIGNGRGGIPYSEFGSGSNSALFITQGITGMQLPSEKPVCYKGGTFIAAQIYETCKHPSRSAEAGNEDTRPWCVTYRTYHNDFPCDPEQDPYCALWFDASEKNKTDPAYPYEIKWDPDLETYKDIVLLQNGSYDLPNGTEVTDQDGNLIKKPLNGCSDLYGCKKGGDLYHSIIWKANNRNCINCIIGDNCDFQDLKLAYITKGPGLAGLTAQEFIGSNHCFYAKTQNYVWETDDNKTQLYPIFKNKSGCVDLDSDTKPNNDEDDLVGCSKLILKEQIIFKFNSMSFVRENSSKDYPGIQSTIIEDNVLCANKSVSEPLWTPKENAYDPLIGICNKTKMDIIENYYEPYYIKQEITNILTSGNMAFYIMKPDIYYINDYSKLSNYSILTDTKVQSKNSAINKMYIGESGEILLINRNGTLPITAWDNGELVLISKDRYGNDILPLSCDPYTTLTNRDPAFSNKYFCGYWPTTKTTNRILAASLGHRHGMYIIAAKECYHNLGGITFDIIPECTKGYVIPIANGTGFTGLNGPVPELDKQSDFWKAVDNKRSDETIPYFGITHSSESIFVDDIKRTVNRYQASSGYYHSCIIADEELIFNGIEYKPGDVICWGVGIPGAPQTKFSYDQAKSIKYQNNKEFALEVSCGNFHTLVFQENNGRKNLTAYGAGTKNQNDAYSSKFDFGQSIIPNNIKNIEQYIKYIGCGPFHNGVIFSTEQNKYGYIGWGYGTTENAWIKSKLFSKKVVDFSMGDEHVVVLFEDGTTDCLCDNNNDGKCDISTDPLLKAKKFKHIYAKGNTTLAVDKDDTPYIFGNIKDNLETIPPELTNLEEGRIIKKIAAGKEHNLVIKGYVDDALGFGEVLGFGNDPILTESPTPYIKWIKTGSASNTTIAAIDTPYKQLKIYGDGRNESYINENAYKTNLVGTTGISFKSIEWLLENFGPINGTTLTEYLQFIRREKLKDPINTAYSCRDISAEGFRGVAIKTIPDIKWNNNDIGYNSRIIPWGFKYKNQPRSLNLLLEQSKLVVDPNNGDMYAIRTIPTRVETNVLGTAIKIEKYYIKVGNDSSPFVQYDDYWISYGDNSNDTLGRLIESDPAYSKLNQYSAGININGQLNIFTSFKELSMGRWHTIGIINDPPIDDIPSPVDYIPYVWGNPDIIENFGQIRIPVADDGIPLRFRSISANNYHNVGILYKGPYDIERTINGIEYEDYQVYCWGAESYGSDINAIVNYGQISPPIVNGTPIKAKQVSAGLYHSLALTEDGEAYAWGAGSEVYAASNASSSNPHYSQSIIPVDEKQRKYKFKQLSAGDYHSGGILIDGSLLFWGDNRNNQCNEIYSKNNKFIKIDCANQYTIGLTDTQIVYGWGFGSAESPETLPIVSPGEKNPGYSILSAFPPRETMGLSNYNQNTQDKLDGDINNIIGENNIIVTKDKEEIDRGNYFQYQDVLDTWGDNTFYATDFFEEIFVMEERPLYYNVNYEINRELGIFLNYGAGYINRPNIKYDGGKIYQFIDGHGLNAGFNYQSYIKNNNNISYLKPYPISRIKGITGTPLPIFSDFATKYKNDRYNRGVVLAFGTSDEDYDHHSYRPPVYEFDENGNPIEVGRAIPDRWSANPLGMFRSTQQDGYYGIGPSQFFMIQESDVIDGATAFTFYCNTPRDHYKWHAIYKNSNVDASQFTPKKLDFKNVSYNSNEPFPIVNYIPGFKSTFGINWGFAKDSINKKLIIKEYDWLDAYSFALGWNPNTNERVDYFDLHHNLWTTDSRLKNELPECKDCILLNDIKKGFTPLESISGRFGYNVYTLNMDASNHHASGRGMIKVCGKIDLGDPRIKPWLKAVSSLNECGDPCDINDPNKNSRNSCKEYILDTTALFGSMFYANADATYPLEYPEHLGKMSDADKTPTKYIWNDFKREYIELDQSITEISIENDKKATTFTLGADHRDIAEDHNNYYRVTPSKYDYPRTADVANREGFLSKLHHPKWLKLKYFWKSNNLCDSDVDCIGKPNPYKDDKKYVFRFRPEQKDSLWVCFHVYGNFNWGDNSEGQLGDLDKTEDRDIRKQTYKEKPWIPAFLNANIEPPTPSGNRTSPISCGMYHTVYDFYEISKKQFKTFFNPYSNIQGIYQHNENFEQTDDQRDRGIFQDDRFYIPIQTIKYSPLKPVETGIYIQILPCAFKISGKTYRTAGENTENESGENVGGEGTKFFFTAVPYGNKIYAAGNKHNFASQKSDEDTYIPLVWGGTTFEGRNMDGVGVINLPEFWTQDCANRLGLTAGKNLEIFPNCCKDVYRGISFSSTEDVPYEGRYIGGIDEYNGEEGAEYWRRDQRRNGCMRAVCTECLNSCSDTCGCSFCDASLSDCYIDAAYTQINTINWKPCHTRVPECGADGAKNLSYEDAFINCRACKLDEERHVNIQNISTRADHNLIVTSPQPEPVSDFHVYTESEIYDNVNRVRLLDWASNRGITLFDGKVAQGLFGVKYPNIHTYMAKFQNLVIVGSDNTYNQVTLPPRYKTNKLFDIKYQKYNEDRDNPKEIGLGVTGSECSVFGPGYGLGDNSQRTQTLKNYQLITASAGKYHNAYAGYFGFRDSNVKNHNGLLNVVLPLFYNNIANVSNDSTNGKSRYPGNIEQQNGTLKGFTYSLYDQNIVVWGATYAKQDELPEILLPQTTGKSIFDIDFGDKEIKNIDWSFDQKYILIALNSSTGGEVVIIDAADAINKKLTIIETIKTETIVKAKWIFPSSRRFIVATNNKIVSYLISKPSSKTMNFGLYFKNITLLEQGDDGTQLPLILSNIRIDSDINSFRYFNKLLLSCQEYNKKINVSFYFNFEGKRYKYLVKLTKNTLYRAENGDGIYVNTNNDNSITLIGQIYVVDASDNVVDIPTTILDIIDAGGLNIQQSWKLDDVRLESDLGYDNVSYDRTFIDTITDFAVSKNAKSEVFVGFNTGNILEIHPSIPANDVLLDETKYPEILGYNVPKQRVTVLETDHIGSLYSGYSNGVIKGWNYENKLIWVSFAKSSNDSRLAGTYSKEPLGNILSLSAAISNGVVEYGNNTPLILWSASKNLQNSNLIDKKLKIKVSEIKVPKNEQKEFEVFVEITDINHIKWIKDIWYTSFVNRYNYCESVNWNSDLGCAPYNPASSSSGYIFYWSAYFKYNVGTETRFIKLFMEMDNTYSQLREAKEQYETSGKMSFKFKAYDFLKTQNKTVNNNNKPFCFTRNNVPKYEYILNNIDSYKQLRTDSLLGQTLNIDSGYLFGNLNFDTNILIYDTENSGPVYYSNYNDVELKNLYDKSHIQQDPGSCLYNVNISRLGTIIQSYSEDVIFTRNIPGIFKWFITNTGLSDRHSSENYYSPHFNLEGMNYNSTDIDGLDITNLKPRDTNKDDLEDIIKVQFAIKRPTDFNKKYKGFYFTLGTDNDLRISSYDSSLISYGWAGWNLIYSGHKNLDGTPDKTKAPTDAVWNTEASYIALGHKNGILKIIDPFNRFALVNTQETGRNYTNILKLECGDDHTCLLYSDDIEQENKVICWGDNTEGQCNWPKEIYEKYKLSIPNTEIEEIWAGGYHNCITTNQYSYESTKHSKSPFCWGKNNFKQTEIPNTPIIDMGLGREYTAWLDPQIRNVGCSNPGDSGGLRIKGNLASFVRNRATTSYSGNNTEGIIIGNVYSALAAGTTHIIGFKYYNNDCSGSTLTWTFTYDTFGIKYDCLDTPNWNEGIPYDIQGQIDSSLGNGHVAIRKNIEGFDPVYLYGDNTYKQSLPFYEVNTKELRKSNNYLLKAYTSRNRSWSYYSTASIDGAANIDSFYLSSPNAGVLKNVYDNYPLGINAGGYHNSTSYRGTQLQPIWRTYTRATYANQQEFLYGWGNDTYGQISYRSAFSTYNILYANPTNFGPIITLGKNHTAILTSTDDVIGTGINFNDQRIFGLGRTLERQVDFSPVFTDAVIGNGYALYNTDLGLILPKVSYNTIWYDRNVNSTLWGLYNGGQIGGCSINPFSSYIRSFRTIREIATGVDQAMFITNEGKLFPVVCLPNGSPSYYTDISGSQFSLNNLPGNWNGYAISSVGFGLYHISAVSTSGKIYTYGVSPTYRFSGQYNQSTIPAPLKASTDIKYMNAGKYHTNLIISRVIDYGNVIRRFSSYGKYQLI